MRAERTRLPTMFKHNLQDLVKGIRANKGTPAAQAKYVAKEVAAIKSELQQVEPRVKVQAVSKLIYLEMIGHDIEWAAFHVVEVMSLTRFSHKRMGYLAAAQCFRADTPVVLLTTNLLKKELKAANKYEVGLAVNCLANIATPDLARDLLGDVVNLLSSSRPYVRKKAVLLMYKLYLKFPEGLRLTFDRLKARLEDDDHAVMSSAVHVICELARKMPRNYLALAPQFFNLLTHSSNNWMLIKVVKLLGSLVPEEPRLARKLLEPLARVIESTPAKSLLYEAIQTVTKCLPYTAKKDGKQPKMVPAVVRLCTERLREFIEDEDQNLKYLGLVGLAELMKSQPKAVSKYRAMVMVCLDDEDVTIRLRALELLTGMVTRRSLPEIVQKLLELYKLAEGYYREELVTKIIFICSRDMYAFLTDFAWYLSILVELAYTTGSQHGSSPKSANLVAEQIMNIALRVVDVRPFAVASMVPMLTNSTIADGAVSGGSAMVLYAAAWCTGEYCELIAADADAAGVLCALLRPTVAAFPPNVQCVFLQAALKLLAMIVAPGGAHSASGAAAAGAGEALIDATPEDDPFAADGAAALAAAGATAAGDASVVELVRSVLELLRRFERSVHVEVQERATNFAALLAALAPTIVASVPTVEEEKLAKEAQAALGDAAAAAASTAALAAAAVPDAAEVAVLATTLPQLFLSKLGPVKSSAQRRVPLPEGLDLSKWISRDAKKLEKSDAEEEFDVRVVSFAVGYDGPTGVDDDGGDILGELGLLGSDSDAEPAPSSSSGAARRRGPYYLGADDAGAGSDNGSDSDDDVPESEVPIKRMTPAELGMPSKSIKYTVMMDDDEPEGALDDDDDVFAGAASSSSKARRRLATEDDVLANIDLSRPLGEDDLMPVNEHRQTSSRSEKKKSKKHKKKKEKKPKGGSSRSSGGGGERKEKHKKKSKKIKSGAAPADAMDLLDMGDLLGFEDAEPVAAAAAAAAPMAAPVAAPVAAAPVPSAPVPSAEGDEAKGKKKKKKKKHSKEAEGAERKKKKKKKKER